MPPLVANELSRENLDLGTLTRSIKQHRLAVEPFTYPAEFVHTAAGRLPFSFTVDADTHFVATHLLAAATATAGSGTAYESFKVRIRNVASGRDLENDEVLGALYFGTIGIPYKLPIPYLFRATQQFTVISLNLVAGANTVRIGVDGYRVYIRR